jgi:hypothetical protein
MGPSRVYTMLECSEAYYLLYKAVVDSLIQHATRCATNIGTLFFPFCRVLNNGFLAVFSCFLAEKTALFPFFDNFCRLQRKVESPLHLNTHRVYDMRDVFKYKSQERKSQIVKFDVTKEWPVNDCETTLDDGQVEALKHLLTSRVALVQGPPGTGKTYVTLKAASGMILVLRFFVS